MHDIRLIRDDPTAFDRGLASRGLYALSSNLIALDDKRRAAVSALQLAQESRNSLSKEIGAAKKARDEARAAGLMEEVARLKQFVPELEEAERAAIAELKKQLAEIPNIPGPDVPQGRDEHGNVLRHSWGSPRNIESPKQHFELGESWRATGGPMMDFETASRLSGSRFVVLRGQLARMERALGQFMIDLHTGPHGYTEVAPPLMVRDEVMFGTAQLPKFETDQFFASRISDRQIVGYASALRDFMPDDEAELIVARSDNSRLKQAFNKYKFERDNEQHRKDHEDLAYRDFVREFGDHHKSDMSRHWLIPTAEVPLTNLVRESILSEDELPLRFAALTPCFRAEAGAAGRDTRGMLRQHQFTKCELVSITTPEASAEEHERMLACAEAIMKALELPYRVMTLCAGDMGFAATKTYDIEVWMPGQGTFREISSCSSCGDFQARRMEARYRPKGEKGLRYVHTLNGSGTAVGRALIAVMENYQQPDGSVTVPAALRPYMGGLERIGGAA